MRRRGEEKNKMAPLFERAGKMMCSTRYKRRGTNLAAAVQTDTLLLIMVAVGAREMYREFRPSRHSCLSGEPLHLGNLRP